MDVQFTHLIVDIPVFFILTKGLQKSSFEREFVEVILARVDETNSPYEQTRITKIKSERRENYATSRRKYGAK